jgi:type I restriction enzyme S subunit
VKKSLETQSLGDLCDIIGGGTPAKDKPAFYDGEIPWATVRDMRQDVITETEFRITKDAVRSSATNIVPAGNVVIATRVGLGKVCLLGQDTAINQDLRGVVPRDRDLLAVRYLYWWLKSTADVIVAEGTGATVQGVRLPFVKSLQIPVPPLAEQQRIVGILDEALQGVATAKAHAEQNLRNARALFESHLQSVFSTRGPGWVEKHLKEVCEKITDGTHQTPKYFDDGIVFLSSRNVTSGAIDWDRIKYIDAKQHLEMHRRVAPRRNDILLAKNGTTGVAAIVDRDTTFDIYVSLALLRPLPVVRPRFLLHFINSPTAKVQFNKRLKGIGVPNLHLEEIREVKFAFPADMETQDRVVDELDDLHKNAQQLSRLYERKLAALDALKKSLLREAFSGQL